MIDIESNPMFGMDFADLEMRIVSQMHDEMVIESTGVGTKIRMDDGLRQLTEFAKMYGVGFGKTHDDMLDAMRVNYGGRSYAQILPPADAAWQRALAEVLSVKPDFYASQPDEERRRIEQHFCDMARGNPRKSHRAAIARKVLAARMKYVLEDATEPWMPNDERTPTGRMLRQGSVTGRFSGGPTVINQISKRYSGAGTTQITGRRAHTITVDDLL